MIQCTLGHHSIRLFVTYFQGQIMSLVASLTHNNKLCPFCPQFVSHFSNPSACSELNLTNGGALSPNLFLFAFLFRVFLSSGLPPISLSLSSCVVLVYPPKRVLPDFFWGGEGKVAVLIPTWAFTFRRRRRRRRRRPQMQTNSRRKLPSQPDLAALGSKKKKASLFVPKKRRGKYFPGDELRKGGEPRAQGGMN